MLDSLYIHVPFCAEKCDYCAFYSLPTRSGDLQRVYLTRLLEELTEKQPAIGRLRSVFMGGGTPSILEPEILAELLKRLGNLFDMADDCEISMECNPSSLSAEILDVALTGGVNRISMGIQSFSAKNRNTIGRQGDVKFTHQALALLKETGVDNFNCDLIYALPDQTLEEWQYDLTELSAYEPRHVSAYSLMFEEGTPLTRREVDRVEDDLYVEMWQATDDSLGRIGLKRYEISNFAADGRRCRHNWDIWHGRPFAAAGPAAHSFDGKVRRSNPESLQAWLKGAPGVEDILSDDDRAAEILIIGLRTCEGWRRNEFREASGFDFLELRGEAIKRLVVDGILSYNGEELKPTRRGLLLNNYLGEQLL